MLLVSEVEETEIFKICLEYWNHLAAELYRESPFSTSSTPLLSDVPPRRHLYLPVLSQVCVLDHGDPNVNQRVKPTVQNPKIQH